MEGEDGEVEDEVSVVERRKYQGWMDGGAENERLEGVDGGM